MDSIERIQSLLAASTLSHALRLEGHEALRDLWSQIDAKPSGESLPEFHTQIPTETWVYSARHKNWFWVQEQGAALASGGRSFVLVWSHEDPRRDNDLLIRDHWYFEGKWWWAEGGLRRLVQQDVDLPISLARPEWNPATDPNPLTQSPPDPAPVPARLRVKSWNLDLVTRPEDYRYIVDVPSALGLGWTYRNGGGAWVADPLLFQSIRDRFPNAKICPELRFFSVPGGQQSLIPDDALTGLIESGPGWSNEKLDIGATSLVPAIERVADDLCEVGADGVMLDWSFHEQHPNHPNVLRSANRVAECVRNRDALVIANINDQTPASLMPFIDVVDREMPHAELAAMDAGAPQTVQKWQGLALDARDRGGYVRISTTRDDRAAQWLAFCDENGITCQINDFTRAPERIWE